ncbi:hypothetical protein [Hyphobacterium sp.]|jgi:hypothetical protein|uniref:hypothetical protein n=1 Tax=Hyphobacterium sp. TaxID=2004662 RepID=UPI003BA95BBC
MKTFLAVGAVAGALPLGGCMDSALATAHFSHADGHRAHDGYHRFEQDGDVSLMGSDMTVEGEIGGDLSLVGSDLEVRANIGGDMSLAGSDVEFEGRVGGRANIAGSDVTWSGEAGEDVDIAGSDVSWMGSTHGELSIAGSDVFVDGRIDRNLEIAGSDVELTDDTRIGGDLAVAGSDLDIGAHISGDADLVGSRIDIAGGIDGRLMAIAHSRRGWQWSSDNGHQRIRIGGRIGEGSAVCARRVEITRNAELTGNLAVFAEQPPEIADGISHSLVTYQEIGNRDCDDLLEPYGR